MQHRPNYQLAHSRSGYWEIRWTEHAGGRHRSRSHSTRLRDRKQAESYLARWSRVKETLEQQETGVPTIRELANRYELRLNQRGVGATTRYSLGLVVGYFGHLRPAEVTDADVIGYCKHRGVKDATLRRELNVLVALLNHAEKTRAVPRGDIPHVELPPEGQSRETFLDEAEDDKLTKLLLGAPAGRLPLFMLLALRTGARRGAIMGLTWNRVDLKAGFVDYREPGARQTRKRRVPVPVDAVLRPVLEAALAARDPDEPLVLGRSPIEGALRPWRRQNPEFAHVTPHVLRHTAATRWLRQGISIWDVAGLLGDTPETVAKVYGHHAKEDLRNAMAGERRRASLDYPE